MTMKIFIFLLLSFVSVSCVAGVPRRKIHFDSLWLYNYVNQSYMAGGAKQEFATAERKETINIADVGRLNMVLARSKHGGYLIQGKIGNDNIYAGAKVGGEYHQILICSAKLIIDFTAKRAYFIADDSDRSWLHTVVAIVHKK